MKGRFFLLVVFFVLAVLVGTAIYLAVPQSSDATTAGSIEASAALSGADTVGYARADIARDFMFPADHGPHPQYKTEWWYYTGNLVSATGQKFGFQLTFFRSALSPDSVHSTSDWAGNQLYMAHCAIADIGSDKFYAFERFSRGAAGLAGAEANPFRVWLYDWQAASGGAALFPIHLTAATDTTSLDLVLDSIKPLVLQGDRGLSKKGRGEGNASYYYSYTRMAATGSIRIGSETYTVQGQAWLDREWSTSALEEGQTGWDWFSLQLSDNREIMYFQLRDTAGRADAFSSGTLVQTDGTTKHLDPGEVQLEVLDRWKSPHSGAEYPSGWRLRVPAERIDIGITPHMRDQELQVSIRYWEGAVGVQGTADGQPVTGNGYVEMTGYGDRRKKAVR
jgi:predicted secreted hydrolase